MAKRCTIERLHDGTLEILDGNTVIGQLIPAGMRKDEQLFSIRMGSFGGFYAEKRVFKDALAYLIDAHIRVYTNKMMSIKTSANLIYKKRLSKPVNA